MKQTLALFSVMLASCSSSPASSPHNAVIVSATDDSRAELQSLVSVALRVPVLLADDALTKENVLLIERQPHRDANGVLIQGRELGVPERFVLSKTGKGCVLTHERTKQRWVLKQSRCKEI